MNTAPCMKDDSVAAYLAFSGPLVSCIHAACTRCPLKMMSGNMTSPAALIVVTIVMFSRELERIVETTFCPHSAINLSVFVPCGVAPVKRSIFFTQQSERRCSFRLL